MLKNTDQSWSQGIKDLQENTIRTDISQDFSNAQQDVALSNIGLDFIHVDYSLLGTTLDDSTAALIENAKGIILLNSPGNGLPTIFTRGAYYDNLIFFTSLRGVDNVSIFSFHIVTKHLERVSSTVPTINCIKYNIVQSLTDAQKQQARTNIDVLSPNELLNSDNFISELRTKLGLDVES